MAEKEYIEREKAKEMFYNGHTVQSLCERGANTLGEAFSIILDEVPAADVVPVVRARWEYNPGDNIPYCSACMMPQDSECNYCPNCGARMEE